MKKYIILAILLCIPISVGAWGLLNQMGGVPAADGPSSPDLYLEFEQAWTTGSAYTPGGNDVSPDSSIATVSNFNRSSTYSASGTYCAQNPLADKGYMAVDVTSGDVFTSSSGFMEAVVWGGFDTNQQGIFEVRVDSSNNLTVYGYNNGTIRASFVGQATGTTNDDNTDTCTADTACMVQVRWKASTDKLETRVCSDGTCDTESWTNDGDGDAVTTWTSEPSFVYVGAYTVLVQGDIYTDNFKLWNNYEQD